MKTICTVKNYKNLQNKRFYNCIKMIKYSQSLIGMVSPQIHRPTGPVIDRAMDRTWPVIDLDQSSVLNRTGKSVDPRLEQSFSGQVPLGALLTKWQFIRFVRTRTGERPWADAPGQYINLFSKTFHAIDFIMIDSPNLFHIFAFDSSIASIVTTADQFCVHVRVFAFH